MSKRTTEDYAAAAKSVLIANYRQQPLALESGQGCRVTDVEGNEFLDMTAGIAVLALGHSHPKWVAAMQEQIAKIVHTSNLYLVPNQIEAAEAIIPRCFGDRVFFCNSGAEANDAALKLARRYQALIKGRPERQLIVSTIDSFHGRSMATVAVTGQDKYRQDFGELVGPVEFVPFADIGAMSAVLARREACCVIVEPLQAEGGIRTASADYFTQLRDLCTETETLLIFDEVQTGTGRLGEWFGHQLFGVSPDVMTLAKGLGGGMPVGAVVASNEAAAGLAGKPSQAVPHASTFGGNPLAMAAIKATFEIIESEGLLENVRARGVQLAQELSSLVERFDFVTERRGHGLLQGIELEFPAGEITTAAREQGLLLSVAGGTVVRFAPPFVVSSQEISEAVATVESLLEARK